MIPVLTKAISRIGLKLNPKLKISRNTSSNGNVGNNNT
jgi:hypothetical protein